MNRRCSGQKGFTLLEVLVAFALLSIILAAVYSTFFLSQKAIEGVDQSLLSLQEGRMTVDAICREIDSVFYKTGNKNTAFKIEDRDFFGKDASRVTFSSLSPLAPGLSLISYYVEEKEGVLTLFKKIKNAYDVQKKEPEAAVMVGKVEAFAVEVMNNGKWIKTWDAIETGRIPERIRITVTLVMKDRPVALSATAIPKIEQPL